MEMEWLRLFECWVGLVGWVRWVLGWMGWVGLAGFSFLLVVFGLAAGLVLWEGSLGTTAARDIDCVCLDTSYKCGSYKYEALGEIC